MSKTIPLQLSTETLDILKNLSSINASLAIKPGNVLLTMSEAKSIMASATIKETFLNSFSIYDLNDFLSVLNLLEVPEISFTDTSALISSGKTSVTYHFAGESVVAGPAKEIKMPESDLTLVLTQEVLNKIRKASGVMGRSVMSIHSAGEENLQLSLIDPKDSSANKYTIDLDIPNPLTGKTFSFEFLISNFKLLSGDYQVNISKKLISQWSHKTVPIKYYIALEKTSSIN